MFAVLVLDYPPPYFATVSLISIWSTLYVCLMKPKRFASMHVSSNQRGLQQIRSLLTISLRASMDRVCGLSPMQIRLHAQQIQIQMPSKYEYKCALMLRSCDQCLGHCKTSSKSRLIKIFSNYNPHPISRCIVEAIISLLFSQQC